MNAKPTILVLLTATLAYSSSGCRNATKTAAPSESASAIRFEDGTAASGINFAHVPTRTADRLMPEIMGSGVATVDLNRDGAPDVVLVNSGSMSALARPPEAGNQLLINDGKGHFKDQTVEWNLPSVGYGMGVAAGDYDNDGWIDLFLTNYRGGDQLLHNTGHSFEDATSKAGIKTDDLWSVSAGFFDLENDGDLDLWIVRYVYYTPGNAIRRYRNGVVAYDNPVVYDAVPDRLLRNNGDGTFTDISKESGLSDAARKGLALAIGDIDLDGDQDVYVANDNDPNQLWINDGKGTLKEIGPLSGVAYGDMGEQQGSMGADFSDTDGDGLVDIVCTNFQDETTNVFRQSQSLLFRDVSDLIGVGGPARVRLKFGVDFLDADNDGDEDLLVANGHFEESSNQETGALTFAQQATLYENLGNGNFADISNLAGPAFQTQLVGRGLATADLDSDGDLDFIIVNNGGKAQLGNNATEKRDNFVGLWLEGSNANRSAIGARLMARIGNRIIQRQIMGSSSYASICDLRVLLGLGAATAVDELTIFWPGRSPQTIKQLGAGKYYRVVEGQEPAPYVPGEKRF